jgi:hypothetical protein
LVAGAHHPVASLPQFGLRRLAEKAAWIETYRQLWDARFEELDRVVEELKRKEKVRDAVER